LVADFTLIHNVDGITFELPAIRFLYESNARRAYFWFSLRPKPGSLVRPKPNESLFGERTIGTQEAPVGPLHALW